MKRLWLSLLVGCATGRVAPGAKPELKTGDGIIVVGAGQGVRVDFVRFTASPDWTHEVVIPGLAPDELAVMVAPAGKYCVTEIRTPHVSYLPSDPAQSRWCFEVRPQQLSYVGHVEVQELQSVRFQRIPGSACATLKAQYADALRSVRTKDSSLASCTP